MIDLRRDLLTIQFGSRLGKREGYQSKDSLMSQHIVTFGG